MGSKARFRVKGSPGCPITASMQKRNALDPLEGISPAALGVHTGAPQRPMTFPGTCPQKDSSRMLLALLVHLGFRTERCCHHPKRRASRAEGEKTPWDLRPVARPRASNGSRSLRGHECQALRTDLASGRVLTAIEVDEDRSVFHRRRRLCVGEASHRGLEGRGAPEVDPARLEPGQQESPLSSCRTPAHP